MAYNPQNMYNPAVRPDTQGIAPGIAAAGQAIAGGIEQFVSNHSAAKAAEVEMQTIQTMYPDAAAMIDGEKFAAANLAGKQKMLGLAKGYVVDQAEKTKLMQKAALDQQEIGLRAQDIAQRGGYQNASIEQRRMEMMQNAANAAADNTRQERRVTLEEKRAAAEAAAEGQPPKTWSAPVPGLPGTTAYGAGKVVLGQQQPPPAQPSQQEIDKYNLTVVGYKDGHPIWGRPRAADAAAAPAEDTVNKYFPE